MNAAIWLLLAGVTILRTAGRGPESVVSALIIAVLMVGNAGAMLWAGIGVGKRQKRFYYSGLVVLFVNIILTVTDQFGPLDLLTLVIDLALLILLFAARRQYLSSRKKVLLATSWKSSRGEQYRFQPYVFGPIPILR